MIRINAFNFADGRIKNILLSSSLLTQTSSPGLLEVWIFSPMAIYLVAKNLSLIIKEGLLRIVLTR